MPASAPTETIQAEIPARLIAQLQALVDGGWFRDLDEVIVSALRRFAESHPAELMEVFAREDVEWGLHGSD